MKKSALRPWNINEGAFPRSKDITQQITFLLQYAVLAPSSHNTQPWQFVVSGDTVKIIPDYSKALLYADRSMRQMYISVGCALENFLIAASHFGFRSTVQVLPEDEAGNIAVTVRLTKNDKRIVSRSDELFQNIQKRTTNRSPYLKKPVDDTILKALTRYIDNSPIQIDFVADEHLRAHITDLAIETDAAVFADSVFKQELAEWVCSNYSASPEGMPLYGFGIPGPISLFAKPMLRNMPASVQSRIDEKLFKTTPVFLVITGQCDDKRTWIQVGQSFERIALAATSVHVAIAPWAGMVERPETSKKLQELLRLDEKPLFFARVGYGSKQTAHSPRRPIKDVLMK